MIRKKTLLKHRWNVLSKPMKTLWFFTMTFMEICESNKILTKRKNTSSNFLTLTVHPVCTKMAAMPWSCLDGTMIMAENGHDYALMMAWRTRFLTWSPWFLVWSWYDYHVFHDSYRDHGMIIVFPMLFKKYSFVIFFSNSCCHVALFGTLD